MSFLDYVCIGSVPTHRILYIRIRYTIKSSAYIGSLVQHRNSIHDMAYLLMSLNHIESYLMGKIQDQSVSTYVPDSQSMLTLATGF
jgi:hypothetical protein